MRLTPRSSPFFQVAIGLVILVVNLVGEEFLAIIKSRSTPDAGSYEATVLDSEANGSFPGSSFERCFFRPQVRSEIIFPGIRVGRSVGTGGDISFVAAGSTRDRKAYGVIP